MSTSRRPIALMGVPMDLGTHLRGVDMGPSAIRVAGLGEKLAALGLEVHDLGNIPVPHASVAAPGRRGDGVRRGKRLPFAPPVAAACREVMRAVARALDQGRVPLVLGGDHSIAIGTLAGLARHARRTKRRWGLLWVDAHGDCNTPESSPSGNIHGMPLAVATGRGLRMLTCLAGVRPMVDPARTVLFGVSDLDAGERRNIRDAGLRVFTMRDLDERGTPACAREALAIVTDGTDGFHLSFDIDAIDPAVAPGVGTPVPGGLTAREAYLLMEMIADTGALMSCDVVEVNPTLDHRNATAALAADLLASALGARIL